MLSLVGGFVYLRDSSDLDNALDDSLRSRADDLAALVRDAGERPTELAGGPVAQVNDREGFSQILSPRGAVIGTTLEPRIGPALDQDDVERAAREPIFAEREVPGVEGEVRILGQPESSGGQSYILVVGASTDDRNEALAGLARAFLIGAPLAVVLACGLGYVLAGRSLAPVETMRRRAQEITLERSGERLPLPRSQDEIHELGETLNVMLDRLEAALRHERGFVADASHELRTPLAILAWELELADRPDRSHEYLRAAVRSASDEVDRLSRLAEDLLVIARFDQGQLPIAREPVQLAVLLERVRRRFARRATAEGREIALDAPDGPLVNLDPVRIEQALGNLVDNALRHGAGKVRIAASHQDGFVVLEVSDEGAGFAPGFESEAFERFTRADPGRTGGGAGLGLAIVRAIALSHGGEASAVNGSGNWAATVRVTLPTGERIRR